MGFLDNVPESLDFYDKLLPRLSKLDFSGLKPRDVIRVLCEDLSVDVPTAVNLLAYAQMQGKVTYSKGVWTQTKG